MLLVNDSQTQARKHHIILNHGMCAHKDMDGSSLQVFEDRSTFLTLHATSEQFNTDRHIAQKGTNGLKMLLGKNLSRSHDTGLTPIVDRHECTHKRYEGLTRPYITL